MADLVLGNIYRTNFGLIKKYDQDLNSVYKGYIDTLEHDMIAASYGTDPNAGLIVKTLSLVISQQEIDDCIDESRYIELENAVIKFCQKHDVELLIQRQSIEITITINMFNKFRLIYN